MQVGVSEAEALSQIYCLLAVTLIRQNAGAILLVHPFMIVKLNCVYMCLFMLPFLFLLYYYHYLFICLFIYHNLSTSITPTVNTHCTCTYNNSRHCLQRAGQDGLGIKGQTKPSK